MFKRSRSSKPKFRKPGKQGMSQPRHPGDKSVEVAVTLRAYLDQDARSPASGLSRGGNSTGRSVTTIRTPW